MIAETVSKPTRPRLNPYTKALRRERIFSRRRLGWPYSEIAREEGLSQERVRQIVVEALERQGVDRPADHALLQMVRLEKAHEVAAEALAAGDLRAIAPYIGVLEQLDRYHTVGAAKRARVNEEAERERILAKLNRVWGRIEAKEAREAAKRAAAASQASAADAGDQDSGASL
jgi:predicted transcriptional regulator